MKNLTEQFENGLGEFSLVKREGKIAIYERRTSSFKTFEVVRISKEAYPKTKDWGKDGWDYISLSEAEKKFQQLTHEN